MNNESSQNRYGTFHVFQYFSSILAEVPIKNNGRAVKKYTDVHCVQNVCHSRRNIAFGTDLPKDFKITKEEKGIYLDDLLNYKVIFGIMHTK